jgi:4,5-dihydroxyphthalate decarboxylase
MAQKIALTLACGDYEITRPLIDGVVRPDGIELTVLTDMDSTTRHWRFLRNGEFDVAEVSASSYLIARDQDRPLRAIPVFPHRRFRHGFAFVNASKGIKGPKDLVGRKVGVKSFQVTAILWLRGILEHEYGVPHKAIEWVTEFDEDVDFTPPPGLKLTRVPHAKSLETMLVEGEIDALFDAYLIKPFTAGDARVARLFPDYKREEIAYVRKTGIFPIMHVVGLRREIAERHPWAAINLFQAFSRAKAIAMKRMENPRIAPIAWYREAWEEQEAILGKDPWAYGLGEQNRATLNTLAGYSHEQGLIRRLPSLEELFIDVSQGRKRGDEFRI